MSSRTARGKLWSPEERALLLAEYPHRPAREVADMLGRPLAAVYRLAGDLRIGKSEAFKASPASGRLLPGRPGRRGPRNWRAWTDAEIAYLREHFPVQRTREIAEVLGRSASTTSQKARKLGLRKSPEYLASPASGRLVQGDARGMSGRFRAGQQSWNKGKHYKPGGRASETQFRNGQMPHNTRPIGSYRFSKDGYLMQKFSNEPGGSPSRRWRSVHRLVWEAANGPMPRGHVVVFRPGMFTTDVALITLDRLELIAQRDLMKRNSVHTLPAELVEVIRLKSVVQRHINKRSREAT